MTTSARDALWLLFILIIIGAVWSMSGRGIDFSSIRSGPRLSPSGISDTIKNTESIFGTQKQEVQKTKTPNENTKSASQIIFAIQGVQNTDPQKEYITVRNNGVENINLGGAEIKNKDNIAVKIENGENGKPIILGLKETAYILTGKSTAGANFKVNKCSGYFNQFHAFAPTLASRCPSINSLPEADKLDDTCLEYLPKIKSCQMPTSLPTNLGSDCQQFIQTHANYQGCVSDHKNDNDFDKGEWRIFLNKTTEMWAKRNEIIKIVDSAGKIIAEASY